MFWMGEEPERMGTVINRIGAFYLECAKAEIDAGIARLWEVMNNCITRGMAGEGIRKSLQRFTQPPLHKGAVVLFTGCPSTPHRTP